MHQCNDKNDTAAFECNEIIPILWLHMSEHTMRLIIKLTNVLLPCSSRETFPAAPFSLSGAVSLLRCQSMRAWTGPLSPPIQLYAYCVRRSCAYIRLCDFRPIPPLSSGCHRRPEIMFQRCQAIDTVFMYECVQLMTIMRFVRKSTFPTSAHVHLVCRALFPACVRVAHCLRFLRRVAVNRRAMIVGKALTHNDENHPEKNGSNQKRFIPIGIEVGERSFHLVPILLILGTQPKNEKHENHDGKPSKHLKPLSFMGNLKAFFLCYQRAMFILKCGQC